MEISESFSPNTRVLTDSTIGLLDNFLSASAFNSLVFLTFGEVDCRILPIIGIQRPPEGGAALVPLITQG